MIPGEYKEFPEADAKQPVELIGGPLDGLKKEWVIGVLALAFDYYGGEAEYAYEGTNKAVYLRG